MYLQIILHDIVTRKVYLACKCYLYFFYLICITQVNNTCKLIQILNLIFHQNAEIEFQTFEIFKVFIAVSTMHSITEEI